MAIKHGAWIQCDECGNGAGDAGVAIPAPFATHADTPEYWRVAEQQALAHAFDNGFTEDENSRLLCWECSNPDDEDADDESEDEEEDDH